MAKERNGSIIKWIAILVGFALAAAGWVYSLGVQGEQLKNNGRADEAYHPQVPMLDTRVTRVEENIKSINQNFADFQRQAIENQKEILRALARP